MAFAFEAKAFRLQALVICCRWAIVKQCMFAGRRAQAYCLSPVPTGGDLLVHTLLPHQREPQAPAQLMASPAPNDERWRVFVSSCANTGVLILANSTTTISHLQGVTYRFRCFFWLMLMRSNSASITSLAVFLILHLRL